jgi:hypothetical protein
MNPTKTSKKRKQVEKKDRLLTTSYIFGGISFIPLMGIPFGIVAIIIGAMKKTKTPIILGICGILLTVLIYGGLFFMMFANFGPYYELKGQVTEQMLTQTRGQILIYKEKYHKLPAKLDDIGTPSQNNFYMPTDMWMRPIIYKPHTDGTFELRSSGPDGIPYTRDDIVSRE